MDSIYLDLSKAFDTVQRVRLLHKLWGIGIHGVLFQWLKSYLSVRKQIVRLRGYDSRSVSVTSGVPQGSHLGPRLFIIFINDIAQNIKHCKLLIYADDVKLFRAIDSPLDFSAMQRDLIAIRDWVTANHLRLNVQKCQFISFYKSAQQPQFAYELYDEPLQRVSSLSELGVIFYQRLSFREHLEFAVSKAHRSLGFLMRNTKEFCNPVSLIYLYRALVLPGLLMAHLSGLPIFNKA